MKKHLKSILLALSFGLNFVAFSGWAATDPNDDRSILDQPGYNSDTPVYTLAPSRYAAGIKIAIHGFPYSSALGDIYELYGDWILPYQKAGVISFGGDLGIFAMRELLTAFPYPNYLNSIIGGHARYQLRLTPYQLIVPTVSLEYMYYRLMKPDNSYLTGTNVGASFGVFINLGWLDRATARDAYQSLGMTKSYFTAEIKNATFSNTSFILNGSFWLFGLRTEFE